MLRMFALLACLAVAAPALAQPQTPPPQPSCDAAEYRALDFWVGDWDVSTSGSASLVGHSHITREQSGCAIIEHWTAAAMAGTSLNAYDRETHRWEQFWVSSSGEVTHFIGNPIPGGMQLTAEGEMSMQSHAPYWSRVTLTTLPGGAVEQVGETSGDGQIWTKRYDFTYRHHN